MLSEVKKKRLEDPKFISSMQKGAILRKCVNIFFSLIVAKVTPVFKKGARKDVNNYFVLLAFQEQKASRMLNGKLPLPRIGSGYPIL